MIVVDTNALSELARPTPAPRVLGWFRTQEATTLYLASVTVAEVGYGVARLAEGRRRSELEGRLDVLVNNIFADRVLSFDKEAAELYGGLMAGRDRVGRPIEIADAQIAAICRHHDAKLATRNTRDFEDLGLTLVDPWTA